MKALAAGNRTISRTDGNHGHSNAQRCFRWESKNVKLMSESVNGEIEEILKELSGNATSGLLCWQWQGGQPRFNCRDGKDCRLRALV